MAPSPVEQFWSLGQTGPPFVDNVPHQLSLLLYLHFLPLLIAVETWLSIFFFFVSKIKRVVASQRPFRAIFDWKKNLHLHAKFRRRDRFRRPCGACSHRRTSLRTPLDDPRWEDLEHNTRADGSRPAVHRKQTRAGPNGFLKPTLFDAHYCIQAVPTSLEHNNATVLHCNSFFKNLKKKHTLSVWFLICKSRVAV